MIDPKTRNLKIITGSLLLMGLAWQQIEATRLGYEVERIRHQARILRGRIGALQVELETRLSPAQLDAQAKATGMVQCEPSSLRVLGAPRAPGPQDGILGRFFARRFKAPLST